jgi:hypothetical protein
MFASGKVSLYLQLYSEGYGLTQIDPFSNPRTMAYLYYLDKMVEDFKLSNADPAKMTWMRFVNNYTYPIPLIRPSAKLPPKNDLATGRTTLSSKSGSEASLRDFTRKFTQKPRKGKSSSDIKQENIAISDPEKKLAIARGRKNAEDNVGDSLFTDCKEIINKIHSLDDIYDNILNRYSIPSLSVMISIQLLPKISFDDLREMIMKKAIEGLGNDKIDEMIEECRSAFPDIMNEAQIIIREKREKLREQGIDVKIIGDELEN